MKSRLGVQVGAAPCSSGIPGADIDLAQDHRDSGGARLTG
jgi:hypothetical protein